MGDMKTLLIGICLFILVTAELTSPFKRFFPYKKGTKRRADYETKYFTQQLDHFDFADDRTFQQKYLISDKYWGMNNGVFNATAACRGPIFFYSGNEGSIELFWENTGFVTEYLAPKYGALLLFAEHRYYGTTLPLGKNSYDRGNTKWLSSEQALADYAVLIPALKSQLGADSCPVVTFGGSYGGMLSGWFRLKYPHVVVGAIAASAPILQFYNTGVSQWSFQHVVTEDFEEAGCADTIRTGFQKIQSVGQSQSGRNTLSNLFSLCAPLQSTDDVNTLINWAAGAFVSLAMIDYPYPADFLEPVPAWPVTATCKQMQDTLKSNDLLVAFVAGLGIYFNYTGNQVCYNLTVNQATDVGDLGWDYQSCTEMVMPISQNGTSDMFLPYYFDLNAITAYCRSRWGVTPRPNWVTTYYGGAVTPNGPNLVGSNIVWSNGRLDPWSSGGVRKDVSQTVAVFIQDGAHHLDLRSPNIADPQSVIQARATEESYIRQWINLQ